MFCWRLDVAQTPPACGADTLVDAPGFLPPEMVSRCLTESRPGCRPGGKLKHALPVQLICRISFSLSRRAELAPVNLAAANLGGGIRL